MLVEENSSLVQEDLSSAENIHLKDAKLVKPCRHITPRGVSKEIQNGKIEAMTVWSKPCLFITYITSGQVLTFAIPLITAQFFNWVVFLSNNRPVIFLTE